MGHPRTRESATFAERSSTRRKLRSDEQRVAFTLLHEREHERYAVTRPVSGRAGLLMFLKNSSAFTPQELIDNSALLENLDDDFG